MRALNRLRWLARQRRVRAKERSASLPEGAKISFAVHGEDSIVAELLWRTGRVVDEGFYVDIGSYHPWIASNTAMLYRQGWSGIAVDPNPFMVDLFRGERPRDTVVEAALAWLEDLGADADVLHQW